MGIPGPGWLNMGILGILGMYQHWYWEYWAQGYL